MKVVLLGALLLGILSSVAVSQQDGGRMKFSRPSPEDTFKQLSGGKDVIVVAEVQAPEQWSRFLTTETLRERMKAYVQKKGISNGQLTLEQYKDYSEDSRREMMEKFQKGDFSMIKRPDSGSSGEGSSSKDKGSEESRGKGDRGDRGDRAPKIDRSTWGRELEDDKPKAIPEEKRVVYRVGNLPKDLPAWFTELDKDKDGQVGLYEWKAGGRKLEEFQALDANADGFITVEEVLRSQRATAAKKESEGKISSLLPTGPSVVPLAGSGSTAKTDKGSSSKTGWGSKGKYKGWGGK